MSKENRQAKVAFEDAEWTEAQAGHNAPPGTALARPDAKATTLLAEDDAAGEARLPVPANGTAGALGAPGGRLAALWQRRPRFSSDTQRRAGRNLLRFFILMLVCTLLARGSAAATLPRVQTTRPQAGEIVQRVRGTGTVAPSGSLTVKVPDGLTVKETLATPGQVLAAGGPLARFDPEEVARQLQREENALAQLRLKLQGQQRSSAYQGSALEGAQRTHARAQQDRDATASRVAAAQAQAQQALDAARAAEAEARAAYEAAMADAAKTDEERAAALATLQAAQGNVTAAQNKLDEANRSAESANQAAQRALEDAAAGLATAQATDAEQRQQHQQTADQNKLDAESTRLDIAAQQEKVDLLQALAAQEGRLLTAAPGVAQQLPAVGSTTGADNPFLLADTTAGYEAELWLAKKDAQTLVPGDECEVALAGGSLYYRPTAPGTVLAVDPPGEDGRARVRVRLPQDEWKNGQSVEVQVVQQRQKHALCVPLSALHADSEGYFLLMLEEQTTVLGQENIAVRVPVTVVAQDDQLAAVEGALGERDTVITHSSKAVQPGDSVRVAT